MKTRSMALVVLVGFMLGLTAPAAFATRAVTGWKTVFGHSTSCTLLRASINSENLKAGAQIHNYVGCNAANASRTVPPGYLGAKASYFRTSTMQVCGFAKPWAYNSTTTDELIVTSNVLYVSSSCPAHAAYQGIGAGKRWSEGAEAYRPDPYVTITTAAVNF